MNDPKKIAEARVSLDRLRFAVEMMGRPATGERLRDPRLGFSVGPTSEQEAYANVEAVRLLDVARRSLARMLGS